jgi:predicted RNase H-like nuclease (RuvC/YqgF family)
MKQELDQTLACGVETADSHFVKGKTLFENVTFLTNIPKPKQSRKKKRDDSTEGKDLEILTKEQEKFNKTLRRALTKVDSSFEFIKTKIDALVKLWSESEEKLDCLVWTASGIHNNCV